MQWYLCGDATLAVMVSRPVMVSESVMVSVLVLVSESGSGRRTQARSADLSVDAARAIRRNLPIGAGHAPFTLVAMCACDQYTAHESKLFQAAHVIAMLGVEQEWSPEAQKWIQQQEQPISAGAPVPTSTAPEVCGLFVDERSREEGGGRGAKSTNIL